MTLFWTRIFAALLALSLTLPAPSNAQAAYSQAELDRMLAPIALYPDPLLSQVLMAATHPLELVELGLRVRALRLRERRGKEEGENCGGDPLRERHGHLLVLITLGPGSGHHEFNLN